MGHGGAHCDHVQPVKMLKKNTIRVCRAQIVVHAFLGAYRKQSVMARSSQELPRRRKHT